MCAFVYEYERCVFLCGSGLFSMRLPVCGGGHICASFCCERLGVTTLLPLLGDLPHRGLAWAEAEARDLAGE